MKTHHEMIFKFKHILRTFSTLAVAAALCACSHDDLVAPGTESAPDPDAQLVISLAVPTGNDSDADAGGDTEADAAPATRADMTPTDAEGKVSSLKLIAFGYDGGTQVVNRNLLVPSKMPVKPQKTAIYQIGDLAPGNYKVYVLANFGVSLDGVATEGELRQRILDYTSTLPAAGELPMVYEPSSMLSISEAGTTTPAQLECSMKIAAVKVRYNLIFDKAFNSDIFGDAGLRITGVSVKNVAKQSYVLANPSRTDIATRDITATGSYFNGYTENQANASRNDADVIAVSGQGAARPSSYTGKWVWQGTAYLPERYVAADGTPTTMVIDAVVTDRNGADGNVRCRYEVNLAAYDGAPDEKSMPRSTYYELVGKIKTLGSAELDASISAKNWEETLIDADFTHTYLKLSKTSASVTSLANDQLTFETDGRGSVEFECDRKFQGKNAILAATNTGDHTITFSVNPEVQVSQLTAAEQKGTARCYIKAGNIRKAVDVKYDITPFFFITPLSHKIIYDGSNPAVNVKEYAYRTNLGGVMITSRGSKSTVYIGGSSSVRSTTSTVGSSRLTLSCADPNAAIGTIVARADNNPGTTMTHLFDAYPRTSASNTTFDNLKQEIQCVVMKPLGSYRIYFRAINDWHTYNGGDGNVSGEWLKDENDRYISYPTEYYGTGSQNNNWIDFWHYWGGKNYPSNSEKASEGCHRVYIWTQEGETTSADKKGKIWRFTNQYNNAPSMTADNNSPGWYYYDLGYEMNSVACENGATGTRVTKPGTTLMIFFNDPNGDKGFTVHRASHHLDPGIPLFDYEDREGWIIYDPTSEPYYRIYDEKPYVEDVVYTVYSDKRPTGWTHSYGVAENNASISGSVRQWTIRSNNVSNVTTERIGSKTYYKYQIRMKAVRGDYEKAIRICGIGNSSVRVWYFRKNNHSNGWDNPRIYIYKDNGGTVNAAWNSTPSMTRSHSADGGVYYYYDVPSNLTNGYVVFQDDSRGRKMPDSGGFSIDGTENIYYSDTGSWMVYGQPVEPVLFDGRTFPGNTGYYNSSTKRWTAGKPN